MVAQEVLLEGSGIRGGTLYETTPIHKIFLTIMSISWNILNIPLGRDQGQLDSPIESVIPDLCSIASFNIACLVVSELSSQFKIMLNLQSIANMIKVTFI